MSEQSQDNTESRPSISKAGIIYGDIIYWITIAATVIVLIGSIITFTTEMNYMSPNLLLSDILAGKSVDEIWTNAAGQAPQGHWYMSQLGSGNGITAFGIALGVFSVIPAIFAASFFMFKEKKTLYAAFAFLSALITIAAMLGLLS